MMRLLHKIIFWSHLLAGVIAGLVIFIMSATGVVLMYEHQLVKYAERDVREITPSDAHARRLSLDDLVANAREQNSGLKLTSIVLRKDSTASVAVGFGRNGVTYVNPYTGAVLGAGSKLHDWFHDVVEWHRWLGRAEKAAPPGKPSPAFVISPFSGLPSAESTSGGRGSVGAGAG